ncbi:MAG: hypothetical protein JNK32_04370, partial [Anaerolineales bacterium]|nr:hypothetical protein [Anaerolineales bacterium]
MHRHKKSPFFPSRKWGPFRGWMWLIVLGFIFSGGGDNWWPGILIAIGVLMIFGSLFREERRPDPQPHHQPPPPMDAAPHPAPR